MAAFERLIDRLGTRGEPSLQRGQRKADCPPAFAVCQCVRPAPLFRYIVGHGCVQRCLLVRQGVVRGVGPPFRKERGAVKLEQFLFDHPAHNVGHIDLVGTIAELAIKAIRVE